MAVSARMIEKLVNLAWNSVQAELTVMGGEAKPKTAPDVFSYSPDGAGLRVDMAPVTLRLPERAANSRCTLYVTVEGSLNFEADCDRKDPRASKYRTLVGYFREMDGARLKHVYGVHYDHDDQAPAHPVYHSQMCSMRKFVPDINQAYHRKFSDIEDEMDMVRGVLRNVRIPTAHMDPFSVLLQIAGDHLVSEAVDDKVSSAFARLRRNLMGFRSLPFSAPRLEEVINVNCFRANHWYA